MFECDLRKIAKDLRILGEEDLVDKVLCALSAVTGTEYPNADLSYSYIMRQLRKGDKDRQHEFQISFKQAFDEAIDNDIENPEEIALMTAMMAINYDKNELKAEAAISDDLLIGRVSNAKEIAQEYMFGQRSRDDVEAELKKIIEFLNNTDDVGEKNAYKDAIEYLNNVLENYTPEDDELTDDSDIFIRELVKLTDENPEGALLSVKDLRSRLDFNKEEFDNIALNLAHNGIITLHYHDFPGQLNKAEKDKLIYDEKNNIYYMGVVFRNKAAVQITNRMKKFATTALNLGNAQLAGKGIANIIGFLMQRIESGKRSKLINKLKEKIWNLNELELYSKKTPDTAAIGQSVYFIKTVLLGHNPAYIRDVLKYVVMNLH